MTLAVPVPDEVLQYIKVLVWPVFAGVAVLVLKKPISRFIESAKRLSLRAPGIEAEVERDIKEAVERVDKVQEKFLPVAPPAEGTEQTEEGRRGAIEREVINDPTGSVLRAWERLNEALMQRAAQMGVAIRPGTYAINSRIMDSLPRDVAGAIQEFRRIRNEVAHAQTVLQPIAAFDYVESIARLIAVIQSYPPAQP